MSDLDKAKNILREEIRQRTYGLHPEDRVKALRDVEKFAGEEATKQQEINEEKGVPER